MTYELTCDCDNPDSAECRCFAADELCRCECHFSDAGRRAVEARAMTQTDGPVRFGDGIFYDQP